MKKLLLVILASCFSLAVLGQQERWVDSVYASLTLDEKISQMFMVAAYSNRDAAHVAEIDELVTKYKIGGLIFFQGGPIREEILTNRYQDETKVPLFIAIDGEWGLAMRLDSTIRYPHEMTLGAIQDNQLIYEMGDEIGKECARLGIHINFAPVVDVNVNPLNPVIGDRSFGEDKYMVTEKARMYMKGLQNNFVLANAKHFPGHGDTDADSHLSLPIIKHDLARLKEIELYPFRELFKDSLTSIMVAHLHVPALDSTPNLATTLSKKVVTDLLRDEMGFEGLIFTDALNMKGVAAYHAPGEVDLMAYLAGNDVLLYAEDVPKAISKIKGAINSGLSNEAELEHKVKKILRAKYWAKVGQRNHVEHSGLVDYLNREEAKALNLRLYKAALTVAANDQQVIPIRDLKQTFASVSIGRFKQTEFQDYLSKYAQMEHYQLKKTSAYYDAVFNKVKNKDVVFVAVHNMSRYGYKKFGVDPKTVAFVNKLAKQTKVVLTVFGSPYSLKYFDEIPNVICAYEENWYTQSSVPQLIFGGMGADGKLPVTASDRFKYGTGVKVKSIGGMGFDFPSNSGVDYETLVQIDTIITNAIANEATPGAQLVIMKKGKVIYEESYGHFTYDKKKPVLWDTQYDLASITKVAASTLVLMKLCEEGKVDLDLAIKEYLPELDTTNKGNMTLRNMLTHQAGLKPFIPFWASFNDSKTGLDKHFFSDSKTSDFCVEVCNGLYCTKSVCDSLFAVLNNSELLDQEDGEYPYKYSDLGYYYLIKIVEKQAGKTLMELAEEWYYKPMGLRTTYAFNLTDFKNVAPTEDDQVFRHHLIQGYVHDPGSALLGGHAGHAGLFSSALDLAKIGYMCLNEGNYGGQDYLTTTIIDSFTTKQFKNNRRGIGWDKPQWEGRGGTSEYASWTCYGHSGFTGTCMWVDPVYDLVYVFVSNRVYPDASNSLLLKTDVRTRIHDQIYKAIKKGTRSNFLSPF